MTRSHLPGQWITPSAVILSSKSSPVLSGRSNFEVAASSPLSLSSTWPRSSPDRGSPSSSPPCACSSRSRRPSGYPKLASC